MTAVERLRSALAEHLVGTGEADTKVLDLGLEDVEDLDGLSAWKLTLFLPRPLAKEWDVERTSALKRNARYRLDELASELNESRDGITSVVLTTQQATEGDTAAEDEPVEGEDATGEASAEAEK